MKLETNQATAKKLSDIFMEARPVKLTFESNGQIASVFVSAKSISISSTRDNPCKSHEILEVDIVLDTIRYTPPT